MTADSIDTIDALMARFVAGSLPFPAHVLVESHLELKPDNRRFVRGMEELAGRTLEDTSSIDLSDRDNRLAAILASEAPVEAVPVPGDGVFPRVLRDFVGYKVDDVPWRTKLPGFKEYDLGDVDGCHVNLYWIRPGRPIPTHTHDGSELTLVLDGAFTDVTGRYGRGDISVADESVEHRPVADLERPCICFAVTDAPLRFTGTLRQRLSDLIGA